ncbi:MAG: hypothetical protein HY399_08090, partial [Elusimicrobia bacterium]|nr:hypothetical protein [Elusimicrobiota bacterium]
MQPATTQITLGDPVEIRVTATFPNSYELVLDTGTPSSSTSSAKVDSIPTFFEAGPFVVRNVMAESSPVSGNQKVQTWKLVVVPFEVGEITFPSLDWKLSPISISQPITPSAVLRVPAGAPEGPSVLAPNPQPLILKSPPIRFQVSSPLSSKEAQTELRDIKPPIFFFPWLWVFFIALLLLSIFWASKKYFFRTKPSFLSSQKEFLNLSPQEEAWAALKALSASGLWERGEIKKFYNELSEILRRYLERR